jgi:hypothetical protein
VLASALVALLLATSPVSDKTTSVPVCTTHGTETTLDVVRVSYPEEPQRHPIDVFTLRALDDKHIQGKDTYAFWRDTYAYGRDKTHHVVLLNTFWTCLGFDPGMRRYLFGMVLIGSAGRAELLQVKYLREDGTLPLQSIFGSNDRPSDYFAVASLVSPLGRHLAFVGGERGNGRNPVDGLYILDTQTDLIRRLADPPDASPAAKLGHEPRWSCCGGAYAQLDPSIVRFEDEDTLVVTYGTNTARARAKSRTTKRFTLWPWPRVEEAPTTAPNAPPNHEHVRQ